MEQHYYVSPEQISFFSNSSNWIAIIALILSFASLIFTIVFNTRAVMPMIDIFHKQTDINEQFMLINKGLGPTKIKKLNYHYKEKIYDHLYKVYLENPNLGSLLQKNPYYQYFDNAIVMAPNEEFLVLELDFKTRNDLNSLEHIREEIEVEIVYYSLFYRRRRIKTKMKPKKTM